MNDCFEREGARRCRGKIHLCSKCFTPNIIPSSQQLTLYNIYRPEEDLGCPVRFSKSVLAFLCSFIRRPKSTWRSFFFETNPPMTSAAPSRPRSTMYSAIPCQRTSSLAFSSFIHYTNTCTYIRRVTILLGTMLAFAEVCNRCFSPLVVLLT